MELQQSRYLFLNTLVLCENTPPSVVSILYCTSHMINGGKNDATYITDQFQRKGDEIDINRKLTDCFFFDGALIVQTADAILCATCPNAICFHGGEMSCPYFSATSPKSNSYRLVLYFLHIFNFFSQHTFQLLVIKCCRL